MIIKVYKVPNFTTITSKGKKKKKKMDTIMTNVDDDNDGLSPKIESNINETNLLLFYLVTSASLFSAFIPTIVSLLLSLLTWDSQMEQSLKRQASDLKEELGSINMTDEFAKYSKIQRKLLKITDELKNKNNRQFIYQTKTRIILYAISYGISAIAFLTIHWTYHGQPVLIFDNDHHSIDLFYPLGPLLSFSTGHSNCLSITAWFFISGFVFRMLVRGLF
ncbi:guided entry of tail-anchored proteins factor 1 isoform X1 [Dermatophagoides pteronyssinus]|uniref:guided entry of tail-anchored proteins factor 1 isoform X1 n=1 Tax=Dermatophagoides pteronyssinus TaxID=6956 RepID=UPI003F6780FA